MSDVSINFEWVDPLGATGPELRATWARLQIVIGGRAVTRVLDEQGQTVRDAVYLPLYPLAEWLAGQWWPLLNEPSPHSSSDHPGYDARHYLASAREGYALPPLRIEPAGSVVKLAWSPERLPYHRLEFPGGDAFWTETSILERELSSLVEAVVTRLDSFGIADTMLQQDWAAIRSADEEERAFCKCAGALGLNPYSLDDSEQQEIEEVGNLLPGEIVNEFFWAARRQELRADAQELTAVATSAQWNTANLVSLKDLRAKVSTWQEPPMTLPWEQGYAFAQRLRGHLGLDGHPLPSISRIADALGTTEADLLQVVSDFSNRTLPFTALMGTNENDSPVFILREGLQPSRLFLFCRALFEYLSSPTRRSALITVANTVRQKRNRAFAAEFLAPASALRDLVRTSIVTAEQTEEWAEAFGVSSHIIFRQLENHHIASVE